MVHDGDPKDGVFLRVYDPDGSLRKLRASIAGSATDPVIEPHATLVHPRTSGLGPRCWSELHDQQLQRTITVRSVAVMAFDGSDWVACSNNRLG